MSQILVGQKTFSVVTIPNLLWTVNGKPRRIFIECFGPTDQVQAQKDALVLSHVMRERIFGVKSDEKEPKVRIAKPL